MRDKLEIETGIPLIWIRITALTCGGMALLGWLVLTASNVLAAPPPTTNEAGKGFNNPFANVPSDEFYDDTDDEPSTGNKLQPNRQMAKPKTAPSAAAPSAPSGPTSTNPRVFRSATPGNPNDNVPDPKQNEKGIEVGGETTDGITVNTEIPFLRVDTETGAGGKEKVTDFNFPDADILDIAKTLGKLTGKNFIFDKNVKGRITIVSNSPITVGDAWKAFLTALDINGYTVIPSGPYLRIARQRDARDKQVKTFTGDFVPDSDALITKVFPLRYIGADEVARTFRSFMPANSRVVPHTQTNTVIVTDTGSNIAKLEKMLSIMDVESFDAGIEVIPVKHASAAELAKLLDQLLPGTSAGSTRSTPRRGGGNFTPRKTKEGGIINTIIADERTNALIVHANGKGVEEVQDLISQLDKKTPAPVGGGKIHVVYLQFAEAKQISQTLSQLSGQGGSTGGTAGGNRAGGTGSNPTRTALFEGSIRVSADEATNSLVITASPADFVTVQRVINKLDIPRDEVYVEVVIMEVGLSRDFEFSANVALPTSGIALTPNSDLVNFLASPIASKGIAFGFKGGNKTNINVGGKDIPVSGVAGLIRALQTNAHANILATPQILTLDNQEATFETSEKIPVATTTATNTAVTQGVSKEPISLSITIKPQINKISNFVKLGIKTKLEDISKRELPAQVADKAFATFERKADTTVIVADTDTVVLGGLVRDKITEAVSKIPLLGDIPILGWLFRATQKQTEKTNLLIFITPHIIRHYERVRAILDKKLQERDEFLEKHTGGDDPLRYKRDEMIRSLPDLKDLLSKESKADSFKRKQNTTSIGGGSSEEFIEGGGSLGDLDDGAPLDTNQDHPVAPPPPDQPASQDEFIEEPPPVTD